MPGPFVFFSAIALAAIFLLYRRLKTRIYIAAVPGPESKSWLFGVLPEYHQGQVGEAALRWQEKYGYMIRLRAPFGEDQLLVSDPKALQHIIQTGGHRFPSHPEMRATARLLGNFAVGFAEGNDHVRHRRILQPAFSATAIRRLVPIFSAYANKLCDKWENELKDSDGKNSTVINVHAWMTRATLDVIWKAAFEHKVDSLDNEDTLLSTIFRQLIFASGSFSKGAIPFVSLLCYLPASSLGAFVSFVPFPKWKLLRDATDIVTRLAKALVEQKTNEMSLGIQKNDVLTMLIKANQSEEPKNRLSDLELYSEMQTIIVAGHETTSNALTWALWELAKNPQIQERLRCEIQDEEREVKERAGNSEFTAADFDSMSYLVAVVKEVLRFHPPAYAISRESKHEELLPLLKPITTTSGTILSELAIPKGQKLVISMASYQRIKEVWGEDADVFNPDRFLDPASLANCNAVPIGVYANLLTFSGGYRSCVGWRFAVYEMQAFLVEIIKRFEFSLTPEAKKIRREPGSIIMFPIVEGQRDKGVQMPLMMNLVS